MNHENLELERHAYNAAFNELGFSWSWDSQTYRELLQRSADCTERIRHYIETRHPHLLRAYDAAFLAEAIQAKKAQFAGSPAAGHA